jgi:fumarylacetoacetate (FAA) hydrolase family protein
MWVRQNLALDFVACLMMLALTRDDFGMGDFGMPQDRFDVSIAMPADWRDGTFLGRVETSAGPSPVLIKAGRVYDMSRLAPTVSDLIEAGDFATLGQDLGDLDALELTSETLLSPVDLQCVKAAGVTFAVSAIERVIEERARGDASQADAIRAKLENIVGKGIRAVTPGSPEAAALKAALIEDGLWSQYLEVAIGPDAEIFTKSPILSAIGWGGEIGVRSDSTWNNPEPEAVLICNSHGEVVGATLGNDVNLRDFEGRSALLLGKAKDNNASCSMGPFIRLFDDSFSLDDVRSAQISLLIEGTEGYRLEGSSNMNQISRDPLELARQAMSEHQYPDGFALFLGTLFAPTQDRDVPGFGFTHKIGDVVTVSNPKLGTLTNTVTTSKDAQPWRFGVSALMRNLAARGLLPSHNG